MPARDEPEDFVTEILRQLVDAFPQIDTVTWLRIEMATRQRWGGLRPYISKATPEQRQARATRRGRPTLA